MKRQGKEEGKKKGNIITKINKAGFG